MITRSRHCWASATIKTSSRLGIFSSSIDLPLLQTLPKEMLSSEKGIGNRGRRALKIVLLRNPYGLPPYYVFANDVDPSFEATMTCHVARPSGVSAY